MSLESGKKLGFTASILNIVVPPIMVVAVVVFFTSLFSSFLTSIFGGAPSAPTSFALITAFLGLAIVAGILALAAYILFLIAMHRLSKYYNEPVIFKNILRALIIQIIFVVVAVAVVVAFSAISSVSIASASTTAVRSFILSLLGIYAVILLVSFALSIYYGLLYKRSFDRLAEKSGVEDFRTTGLLYLIGSVLAIIGIGGLIVWIAWIFAALGYRKLAPASPAPAPFTYSTYPAPLNEQSKRCSVCGAENSPDSAYCRSCGRQIQ
ncbi:MAG: DUF996 domain-containing protein [Candidatus Bathyarchaeota archaeon]|nr:DUF996 domain-containing protein [Candidatus Bathyarchaeota archaeon]